MSIRWRRPFNDPEASGWEAGDYEHGPFVQVDAVPWLPGYYSIIWRFGAQGDAEASKQVGTGTVHDKWAEQAALEIAERIYEKMARDLSGCDCTRSRKRR